MPEKHKESWKAARSILENFQIGKLRLQEWADAGYVRSLKLDDRQQGRRIYKVQDVVDVLDELSRGRQPQQRVKRVQ